MPSPRKRICIRPASSSTSSDGSVAGSGGTGNESDNTSGSPRQPSTSYTDFSLKMPMKRPQDLEAVAASPREMQYLEEYLRKHIDRRKLYHLEAVNHLISPKKQYLYYYTTDIKSKNRLDQGFAIPATICRLIEHIYWTEFMKIPDDILPHMVLDYKTKEKAKLCDLIRRKLNTSRQNRKKAQ